MRPILFFLLLAGAGIITWLVVARPDKKVETKKAEAITISQHTPAFNAAIAGFLRDYNRLSEQFVNWDSTGTGTTAQTLLNDLSAIKLDELKKDSAAISETAAMFIENAKGDLTSIVSEKTIRPQREAFNSLTDNFYQFLNTVRYDSEPLYLQECPMAFDDTKPGLWLSEKEEVRNPYLGLHHPTYGKAMISCGETKTTLNNTGSK